MMKAKTNHGIILVNLAVVALAIVSYVTMNTITPTYPIHNTVTDDRTPTFQWSGLKQSYQLMLDDSPDFATSIMIDVKTNTHSLQQPLDFGTYWWKVKSGDTETEPRQFTVVSTVALSRPEKTTLINSGNAELLVHRSSITGAVTLPVNETIKIGEEENVKAEQK